MSMNILRALLILMAMTAGVNSLTSAERIEEKRKRPGKDSHECSHHSKQCETDRLCPKSLKIPRVNVAKKPVQAAGTIVFNCVDGQLYYSNGTDWVPLEDAIPAPTLLVVDPAIPKPNGVTTFNTIQSALDSLGSKKIVDTTIQIAPGTYAENLVVGPALSGEPNALKIFGDMRDIAGCGINHGTYWNPLSGALPVGGAPASAGEAQFIGAAGSPTLTVNGIGGCVSPDFAAAGVTSADKVLIRHNDGTFFEYSVTSAVGNTLGLSPVLAVDTNGLGAAMCIVPRVKIAPPTGSVIANKTQALFAGLYAVATGTNVGIRMFTGTHTTLDNVLIFTQAGFGIITSPGTNDHSFNASLRSFRRNFGFTAFANNAAAAVIRLSGMGSKFFLTNALVAANAGGLSYQGSLRSELTTVNCRFIGRIINSEAFMSHDFRLLDVIVHSGIAIDLRDRSSLVEFGATDGIRIRGAATGVGPTIGIDLRTSDLEFAFSNVSFSSINPAAVALRVGEEVAASSGGANASAVVSFGPALPSDTVCFNTPAATGFLVQVKNGSVLAIKNMSGTSTLGPTTGGFQISNNSQLTWNAGSFTPTTSSSGILFDVRGNSSLVVPAIAPNRLFGNFGTIFNFDDNAMGSLFNFTSTTTAGGTNLSASNMSRVEIDTATFNLSGANVGINTANGGFVGKKGGTTVTNNAAIPIAPTSCSVLTTTPQSAYPCTYAQGTIVVTP